ncbi:FAD-dependent oxidoreductase [Allostella humosa]|nr:FAD-dependent oxidoreductase [Stella humosa]
MIGAGIVGMSCATHLLRDGHQVTVIDRLPPGEGTSFGNAGMISPDTFTPIAMPGMLRKVPKWLSDPMGPLAIRWSYLPQAMPWLVRWIRAGRIDRVERAAVALRALHGPAFATYRSLLGPDGFNDLIRQRGQLYLWRTDEPSETDRIADRLRAEQGVRADPIGPDEIRQMEPSLAPGFRRGLYLPDNGSTANPHRLTVTLARNLQADGGRVLQANVTDIETGADGVRRVMTDAGPVDADLVVLAAGAWSLRVAKRFGLRVPLETERGYHVMLPNPGPVPNRPISHRSGSFSMTPMEHGLRLAGTVEIAGLDAAPDERRAHILLEQARLALPTLNAEGMQIWMGHRPSTPDSLPVIDQAPGVPGLFLAFGHGHTGLTGAPMTGRLLADLVAGRKPSIDPAPYRAGRF